MKNTTHPPIISGIARTGICFLIIAILSSCSLLQFGRQDPVPQPRYKIGDPYKINGVWYYPTRDLNYDKTGIASWYGEAFEGRHTANGEIFRADIISAAHKTLPLPSVARVTNLENGKSLIIRINDRGPYARGRIIDLSREAARLLGFKEQGIAKVRVKILAEDSLRLEKLAKSGHFPLLPGADKHARIPDIKPKKTPSVSLTTRTKTRADTYRKAPGESAVNLLSTARSVQVVDVAPNSQNIWIQVGAFQSQTNAKNIISRFQSISSGNIFEVNRNGRILYRARLGPVQTIADADALLAKIHQQGFDAAEIVVD